MKPLYLVNLQGTPILDQLKWEEALLRADHSNWCIINEGSPPAIVMGISGKSHHLIDCQKFQTNALPLIRRFSGGGTVVIDPNTLFVTFIFNSKTLDIPPFPQSIMKWTESVYQPVFKDLPFYLKENDYVLSEKKIGGNAQSITKNRWLHHSSFLYAYNPLLMDLLLLPPKMPDYRKQRSHSDFLSCLSEHWSSLEEFKQDLVQTLSTQFDLIEKTSHDLNEILKLEHRQTTRIEMYS